jgi:hypothetical protein
MYAETVPLLKTYAEGKGVFAAVYTEGYIGVPGGPMWAGTPSTFCTPDVTKPYGWACGFSNRWIEEFLSSLDAHSTAYPNEVTTHIYVHGPDMDCGSGSVCSYGGTSYDGYDFDSKMGYAYFDNWAAQVQAALAAHGHSEVKVGIGEGQGGVSRSDAWCGWANTCTVDTNGPTPDSFLTGWLGMLKAEGFHTFNLFLVAGNSDSGTGGSYNWVRQDAGEGPGYTAFRTFVP